MDKIIKSFKNLFSCVNGKSGQIEIEMSYQGEDKLESERYRLVQDVQEVSMIVAEFKPQEETASNCNLDARVIELDYFEEEGECDEIILAIWSDEDRHLPYFQKPVYI